MLCERCKIREATIQYTEVVNGIKKEHNFCTQCAKEMNFGEVSAIFDSEFPFAKILSALLGEEGKEENADFSQIVCPNCHTTYQEFVNNSMFGCPDCYEVFDLLIGDSIKQLQGSDQHKGKHPKYGVKIVPQSAADKMSTEADQKKETDQTQEKGKAVSGKPDAEGAEKAQELRLLRKKLNQAVKDEQYEIAAACRDSIRALEKKTDKKSAENSGKGGGKNA